MNDAWRPLFYSESGAVAFLGLTPWHTQQLTWWSWCLFEAELSKVGFPKIYQVLKYTEWKVSKRTWMMWMEEDLFDHCWSRISMRCRKMLYHHRVLWAAHLFIFCPWTICLQMLWVSTPHSRFSTSHYFVILPISNSKMIIFCSLLEHMVPFGPVSSRGRSKTVIFLLPNDGEIL